MFDRFLQAPMELIINRLWTTDLTHVPTWSGTAYVCFITDVFSRLIMGWRVATTMKT